ncbi:VOC family protein [Paenibacillus sp. 32O-W]|uniref:VOC family protein n=1 Tax=Paenibacillus sp. 32O-W TaxID=1695218 RepID=UPI0028D5B47B|nr:VOC family protein [Paenibacillus sp. 32O-W]
MLAIDITDDEGDGCMQANHWSSNITEITLFVESLQRSKQFYQETFQLSTRYEDEGCVVFDYGNTCINLIRHSNAGELIEPTVVGRAEDGAQTLFTIQVPNADQVCEELLSRGVNLLNGPTTRPWGRRTACFADPDGYVWEIAQLL